MPVILLHGYENHQLIRDALHQLRVQYQKDVETGNPFGFPDEVPLECVDSRAHTLYTDKFAPYWEICADSETTPDGHLIAIAKYLRQTKIDLLKNIDIRIVWSDGKRSYFPKDKPIPDTRHP